MTEPTFFQLTRMTPAQLIRRNLRLHYASLGEDESPALEQDTPHEG